MSAKNCMEKSCKTDNMKKLDKRRYFEYIVFRQSE